MNGETELALGTRKTRVTVGAPNEPGRERIRAEPAARMGQRGWGRVVYISSESAIMIPKEMIDYGMTKTPQLAVSRGFAE